MNGIVRGLFSNPYSAKGYHCKLLISRLLSILVTLEDWLNSDSMAQFNNCQASCCHRSSLKSSPSNGTIFSQIKFSSDPARNFAKHSPTFRYVSCFVNCSMQNSGGSALSAQESSNDIVFACTHCSASFVVDSAAAGLTLDCQKCGKADHRSESGSRSRRGKLRQDFRSAASTQRERIAAHGDYRLYQPAQYPASPLATSSSDPEGAPAKTPNGARGDFWISAPRHPKSGRSTRWQPNKIKHTPSAAPSSG